MPNPEPRFPTPFSFTRSVSKPASRAGRIAHSPDDMLVASQFNNVGVSLRRPRAAKSRLYVKLRHYRRARKLAIPRYHFLPGGIPREISVIISPSLANPRSFPWAMATKVIGY